MVCPATGVRTVCACSNYNEMLMYIDWAVNCKLNFAQTEVCVCVCVYLFVCVNGHRHVRQLILYQVTTSNWHSVDQKGLPKFYKPNFNQSTSHSCNWVCFCRFIYYNLFKCNTFKHFFTRKLISAHESSIHDLFMCSFFVHIGLHLYKLSSLHTLCYT